MQYYISIYQIRTIAYFYTYKIIHASIFKLILAFLNFVNSHLSLRDKNKPCYLYILSNSIFFNKVLPEFVDKIIVYMMNNILNNLFHVFCTWS